LDADALARERGNAKLQLAFLGFKLAFAGIIAIAVGSVVTAHATTSLSIVVASLAMAGTAMLAFRVLRI
jgi:hypothetical protein